MSQKSVEESADDPAKPLQADITRDQLDGLSTRLQGYVLQYQGIVEIESLFSEAEKKIPASEPPLVERLNEYPVGGCDLTNLVAYPPKIQPIPVKPLFFDVAWNYIDYPGEDKKAVQLDSEGTAQEPAGEAKKESKKGWFGFGRS